MFMGQYMYIYAHCSSKKGSEKKRNKWWKIFSPATDGLSTVEQVRMYQSNYLIW